MSVVNKPFAILAGILLAMLAGCAAPGVTLRPPKPPLEEIRIQIRRAGPAQLTAGVGKVEITPPIGSPLAGYEKRKSRPSTGVRDRLYVRALALSDGNDTLLLVSAEILVFPPRMMQELTRLIQKEFGLPRRCLVLTATHTHAGPGGIARGFLYPIVFGRYSRQLEKEFIQQVMEAVRQALWDKEPVYWGAASDEGLLDSYIENRMAADGAVDGGLRVLVLEAHRKPFAVVVSASAHPTILSAKEMAFSGDYPGELMRRVEALYPGSTCLFINGPDGDLRPSKTMLGGKDNFESMERFGAALAEGTSGLVNRALLKPKGDLAIWGGEFKLPPPRIKQSWIRLPAPFARRILPSSTYLNLAAIDNTLFVPLEVEMTAELGDQLRQRLRKLGLQPLLFGYANGYLGYSVTPEQYKQMDYEVGMSWYGPYGGETIIENLCRLAELLFQLK